MLFILSRVLTYFLFLRAFIVKLRNDKVHPKMRINGKIESLYLFMEANSDKPL